MLEASEKNNPSSNVKSKSMVGSTRLREWSKYIRSIETRYSEVRHTEYRS